MSDASDKAAEWLRGRRGPDDLSNVTVVAAAILALINLFAGTVWITIIVVALLVYSAYRMFSRDLDARASENAAFLKAVGPVRPWLQNPKVAFQEARTYKHGTCPECGQRIRVPRGKGKLRVTCPTCGNKFEIKS